MTRPFGKPPTWATDATFTSGLDVGVANKLEPLSGEKAQGWLRGYRPPARKFNWLLNRLSAWAGFVADFNALNWHDFQTTDVTGSLLDMSSARLDGTIRPTYSETLRAWVVPGSSTLGRFYFGDANRWHVVDAGLGASYHMVAEAANRVLLFTSTESVGVAYSRSNVGGGFPFTNTFLPITTPGTYSAGDVTVLPSGRVIVCGTGDAKNLVWYSDDGGVTWTNPIQTNTAFVEALSTRVIAGPGNKVVVLTGPGSGAHRLFVSNDGGATWTERDTSPYANLIDGVYLPGFNVWVFTTSAETLVTGDPAAGPFTATAQSGHRLLANYGDLAMAILQYSPYSGFETMISRDAFTSAMEHSTRAGAFTGALNPNGLSVSPFGQFISTTTTSIRLSLRGS